MMTAVIDVKERFTRKRKAIKIAKRTIKVLTTELGYVANRTEDSQASVDACLTNEITFRWGDRDSRYIYVVFKSIMDKNRKRSASSEHIRFERVMIKATALKPHTHSVTPSLAISSATNGNSSREVVWEPKPLIFTGKTPVSRLKKFHAQIVARLFA
jgi:hypothetical protein